MPGVEIPLPKDVIIVIVFSLFFGFFAYAFLLKTSGVIATIYRKIKAFIVAGWGKQHYTKDCHIFAKKPVLISNPSRPGCEDIVGSRRLTAMAFQYLLFLPTVFMFCTIIYELIFW